MFGALISSNWAISYTRKLEKYYLADIDVSNMKLTWSQRREKAKKFANEAAAKECIKGITEHRPKIKLQPVQVIP